MLLAAVKMHGPVSSEEIHIGKKKLQAFNKPSGWITMYGQVRLAFIWLAGVNEGGDARGWIVAARFQSLDGERASPLPGEELHLKQCSGAAK